MVVTCQKTAIRDLCEITSSKRIYAADYQPDGVPFYRSKEIIEKHKGNVEVSIELFISESRFSEIESKFGAPHPGDLLLTSVGTLGVPYVVRAGERFYFKDGNLTWFRNFKNLDSQFLYYWLTSPEGKSELKKCTIGSSQSAFTIVLLKGMEIELPPLPTQRRVAGILSAYDGLIENNMRRIKILEEMAQTIYREWFVHFRFPGHEKVKMVNSPLGKIPEGWEVVELGDVTDIQWGDTSTTKASYVEEGFNAYSASGLDGKLDHYDFDRTGVVLSAIGANCGVTWYTKGKWSCIKNTIRFWANSKKVSTEFLFYTTKDPAFWPRRGAAQPFISQGDAIKIRIICPKEKLMDAFTEFADDQLELILALETKNLNLRRTRDLLLPKLISGELDVVELEIA